MRRYSLFLSIFFSTSSASAQGIKFIRDLTWPEIIRKAEVENKYILIDAHTTWCGPCKAMNSETFPLKEVGELINNKFLSIQVQMDKTSFDDSITKKWHGFAEYLNIEYQITAYPTILFLSAKGELMHKSVGYLDGPDLIKTSKMAIDHFAEYTALYNKYKGGQTDTGFLKMFASRAILLGQEKVGREVARRFIAELKDGDLLTLPNLKFGYQFTTSSKDRYFPIFRYHSKKVNAILDSKVAAQIVVRSIIALEEIDPQISSAKNPAWGIIEQNVRKKYGAIGLEAYYGQRMVHAGDLQDWLSYGKYYALYYATAYDRSSFHINNVTWQVFENVSDRKVLAVAIKTMFYNIENYDKNQPDAIDTYANLLYKFGRKQEAIKWETKAVQLTTNKKAFLDTLEKMKKGQPTWPVSESSHSKKIRTCY